MDSPERLLWRLRVRGAATGPMLMAELGVSQPTLSRLVRRAGDGVVRMGQARATRYAASRSLPEVGSVIPVYRVDGQGRVGSYGTMRLLAGGSTWLERPGQAGQLFVGLPPFACDMSPQGFLGRRFSAQYPELDLPPRVGDWNDDHRLIALARRGEDCIGDLILGEEALERFRGMTVPPVGREDYPELAGRALLTYPGSSAGGEQPKFAAYRDGRHRLVKFVPGVKGEAAARWRDLLICEALALAAVRAAGIPAAEAEWFDVAGMRFLEVTRFDRAGARGRRGVITLAALEDEYYGYRDSWTRASGRLAAEPVARMEPEDLRRLRWLDAFGQLLGNTDRHFGNVTFFTEEGTGGWELRLAPVYDMLPMVLAPQDLAVVERPFEPARPTAENADVWADAAAAALGAWTAFRECRELSRPFRALCGHCRERLAEVVQGR